MPSPINKFIFFRLKSFIELIQRYFERFLVAITNHCVFFDFAFLIKRNKSAMKQNIIVFRPFVNNFQNIFQGNFVHKNLIKLIYTYFLVKANPWKLIQKGKMLFTIIVGFGIQRISPTILWYPIRSINSPYFRFCSIVKRNFSVLLRISSISPIGIRSAADRLRFTIYPTR